MTCNPTWLEMAVDYPTWETDNPPPDLATEIPTWDSGGCLAVSVQDTFVLRDETVGAGFLYDGAVEEFSQFTDDCVKPWLNNWDTCEDPVTNFWTEETPVNGTPGSCCDDECNEDR